MVAAALEDRQVLLRRRVRVVDLVGVEEQEDALALALGEHAVEPVEGLAGDHVQAVLGERPVDVEALGQAPGGADLAAVVERRGAVAGRRQALRQGGDLRRHGVLVRERGAVVDRQQAGEHGGVGRQGRRRLGDRLLEHHAVLAQGGVEVRRRRPRVAEAADVVLAQGVDGDQDHRHRPGLVLGAPAAAGAGDGQQRQGDGGDAVGDCGRLHRDLGGGRKARS